MTYNTQLDWPSPPRVEEPVPPEQRRAWGKLSYEERYRRQRRDLLRAAANIATKKGYQGTRIADIVGEAGLSKGTFYEHFSSKDECFLYLYRQLSAGMLRAGIAAAEESFDQGQFATILSVCRALTSYVAQDAPLARALRSDPAGTTQAIRNEWEQNLERIVDLFVVIARKLGSSLDEGELRLASEVLVNGVSTVLPSLRRAETEIGHVLRLIARVGCRGLGLSDEEHAS